MARYDTNDGDGFLADAGVVPGLVNAPVIFLAPSALTVSSGELWLGVSGSDDNYGGCIVYVSNDGTDYFALARHYGRATQGVLSAALPAATGTDTVNTITVNTALSRTVLESVDQATVDGLDSLCFVGGEFVAYRDAAVAGSDLYDLTYLKRGLYGSTPGAVSGAQFLLLDDNIFKYRFNKLRVGQTLHFKFQAFNSVESGFQAVEDLVDYAFSVTADGGIRALLSDIPSLSGYATIAYVDAEIAGIPAGPMGPPGATGATGSAGSSTNDKIFLFLTQA